MSFQTKFQTDGQMQYGVNHEDLLAVLDRVDQSERDNILVIVEVDEKNNNAIKSVEVVKGNWFSRAFAVITKLIEELSEGKTYHYGKDAMLHDLSSHLDNMSEEYQRMATTKPTDLKEVNFVLEKDAHFNKTIETIRELSWKLFDVKGQNTINEKAEILYFQHDLAINQFKIEQFNKNPRKEQLIDLVEARKNLYTLRNRNLNPSRQAEAEKVLQQVIKNDTDLLDFLISLSREPKNDLSKLISDTHPNDPLRAQISEILSLKDLENQLQVLEKINTKNEDYINAGIEFIQGFFALSSEIQEKSGLKERFEAVDFEVVAQAKILQMKEKIEGFEADTEKLGDFEKNYKEFSHIMDRLQSAKGKIQDEKLSGIREELDNLSTLIGEKLSSVKGKQLKLLHEKYSSESKENEQELQSLTTTQLELESAQTDAKLLAESHHALVDTIRSPGKGINIASLLTVPAQGSPQELKNLVLALQAVVKQIQLTSSDIEHQPERLAELQGLIDAAELPPYTQGQDALSYLLRSDVVQKVGDAFEKVNQLSTNADQKTSAKDAAAKQARKEAELTKNERIASKKKERDAIASIEMRLLRNVLGMTDLRTNNAEPTKEELNITSQDLTHAFRKGVDFDNDKMEGHAEAILKQLFELFGGDYERRNHLQAVANRAIIQNAGKDNSNEYAFYAVVYNIINRRDALQKEIKEFEGLKHPEFYSMSTEDLSQMLAGYQKKYELPHLKIRAKDVIKRAEVLQAKRKDKETELISSEMNIMTELAAAYKYRHLLDKTAASREKAATEASVESEGWKQLFDGLNHLVSLAASNVKSENAEEKAKGLGVGVEAAKASQNALKARQRVIEARQARLKELLSAETDILGAQAIQGMMDQISLIMEDQKNNVAKSGQGE